MATKCAVCCASSNSPAASDGCWNRSMVFCCAYRRTSGLSGDCHRRPPSRRRFRSTAGSRERWRCPNRLNPCTCGCCGTTRTPCPADQRNARTCRRDSSTRPPQSESDGANSACPADCPTHHYSYTCPAPNALGHGPNCSSCDDGCHRHPHSDCPFPWPTPHTKTTTTTSTETNAHPARVAPTDLYSVSTFAAWPTE
jgi:hypothetical protein